MQALVLLVVFGLVFYLVWNYLARHQGPKARLGPDGTNVREPETFVVHHEGKGQGLDIANTALKERTEDLSRDLPGDTHEIHAPVPGRDTIRMSSPPSDVSRYGDLKVAPGATPGQPGAESKETVLTDGPVGSRPGTPEEPGSPYGKGRRVSDTHRDVELAADMLPPLRRESGAETGLGDTTPSKPGRGRVVHFRGLTSEMAETFDWDRLNDVPPLPAHYGEDVTIVLVRNPRSLYVYWERAGFGDENLRAMLGDEYDRATPMLRVCDVTSGAYPGQSGGRSWTIDVHESDNHWFINDGIEPGREYVVSYERRIRDGRCYLLSHSLPVRTPHEAPDPHAETDVTTGLLYQCYMRQPGEGGAHPGSQWR